MGSYYAGISRYLKHDRPFGSKNGYTTMDGYIPHGDPAEGILINGRYYYEDELKGPNNAVVKAISEMDADAAFKENAMKVLKLPKKSWPEFEDPVEEDADDKKDDKPKLTTDLSPLVPSASAVSATKKKKKKKSSSRKVKKTKVKKKSKKNEKVPVLKNVSNLTGAVSGKSEEFIKNLIAQQSKHR